MQAFGIEVSNQMRDVPARVLEQPRLAYGGGMGFNPGLKVSRLACLGDCLAFVA